jgi:hypothetical protein
MERQAIGRSRGGVTTKIMALADVLGNLTDFRLPSRKISLLELYLPVLTSFETKLSSCVPRSALIMTAFLSLSCKATFLIKIINLSRDSQLQLSLLTSAPPSTRPGRGTAPECPRVGNLCASHQSIETIALPEVVQGVEFCEDLSHKRTVA